MTTTTTQHQDSAILLSSDTALRLATRLNDIVASEPTIPQYRYLVESAFAFDTMDFISDYSNISVYASNGTDFIGYVKEYDAKYPMPLLTAVTLAANQMLIPSQNVVNASVENEMLIIDSRYYEGVYTLAAIIEVALMPLPSFNRSSFYGDMSRGISSVASARWILDRLKATA